MGVLTIGLDILRILAEADGPLTATAIAERVGLHVSNVSRTLRVLAEHGYVRKPTYHSFAPDLGVLALAGAAVSRLPVIAATAEVVVAAARSSGLQATLAALHRDQVLYLHRSSPEGSVVSGVAGGFPLHRSVVGLRLLLDLPEDRALAALAAAGRRQGWDRPTPATPADPAACLEAARRRLRGGVLRTDHWDEPDRIAAAVAVTLPDRPPMAVALNGPAGAGARELTQTLTTFAADIATRLGVVP